MQVTVQDAGPCRKKLQISIPAERVSGEYSSVLDAYARSVRVPGFRPGKVPRNLVAKRFGRAIAEEVRDRLIPEGYRGALAQEKISPVAILGVDSVSFEVGQPLAFSVTLDIPPQFEPPVYRKIPLSGKKVEITSAEVDEAVKGILQSRARYVDVTDRPVQKDDLVQIDYEAVCEGRPVEEMAPGATGLGRGTDFWVHAGENAFLPGFESGLLGLASGERGHVLVDFPADFRERAVAGKKATYFITVKIIRMQQLPALDEAFLKELGVASAEELRSRVEADLRHLAESRERRRLRGEIVKHLLDRTSMDLPASIVEEETRHVIYDMVRENVAHGIPEAQIEEHKSELFDIAGRSAAEKVKARYILHGIAARENITASGEEVSERVRAMARGYGVPEHQFRGQLEKKNMLEGLADQLRVEKTLDFLLAEADISG